MLKITDIEEIKTEGVKNEGLTSLIIKLRVALGQIEDDKKQLATIMAVSTYLIVSNGYEPKAVLEYMAKEADTQDMEEIIKEYIEAILGEDE